MNICICHIYNVYTAQPKYPLGTHQSTISKLTAVGGKEPQEYLNGKIGGLGRELKWVCLG